eukprot:jgi/Bigna1/71621/fgenesh1_pg.16_\
MACGFCGSAVANRPQRILIWYFKATSPNGRFEEGAKRINGRKLSKVEAVGKNLFAFFGGDHIDGSPASVVHVHFGMSGRWAVFDASKAPEPTPTTRLRLESDNLVSHLSAMTVAYGTEELYQSKKDKLGEDGLRSDADPSSLWERVQKAKKSIGKLLMDQSYFAGVGNIYRAEILFKAGVHPEILGCDLTIEEFQLIWKHTVELLRRGFQVGSILTVDPEEASQSSTRTLAHTHTLLPAAKDRRSRYIYNQSKCGRCGGSVRAWKMSARTCYACPNCQPYHRSDRNPESEEATTTITTNTATTTTPLEDGGKAKKIGAGGEVKLFRSHCARESYEERLAQPVKLTVKELKAELQKRGLSSSGRKAVLVDRLKSAKWECTSCGFKNLHSTMVCIICAAASSVVLESTTSLRKGGRGVLATPPAAAVVEFAKAGISEMQAIRSATAAAKDKVEVGEKLSVEHVADLDLTLQGMTVDWTDLDGSRNGRGSKKNQREKASKIPFKTKKRRNRASRRTSLRAVKKRKNRDDK